METHLTLTNNNVPVPTAQALAQVRMNPSFPKYGEVMQGTRVKWLARKVIELGKLRHAEVTATEAMVDATALDARMMQDQYMRDLTFPEIEDAFSDGLFGVYGEYYGITAMALYQFLDGFINSDKKRDAAELVRKTKAQERAEQTKREYEEQQRRIRAEIEEAKRNGTFVPTGSAWYKPQSADDAIAESEAHREKVRRQAEEILKQSKQ